MLHILFMVIVERFHDIKESFVDFVGEDCHPGQTALMNFYLDRRMMMQSVGPSSAGEVMAKKGKGKVFASGSNRY